MNGHLLRIFQLELETQCKFIILGAQAVNEGLAERRANSDQVWFGLQGILVSAANASKLLWGSRAEPVLETRRPLRESVSVTDDSPLSSRRLRNDFEHFDERLEDWFGASEDHIYIGRAIGPKGSIVSIRGKEPEQLFGQFDPTTATVAFWERSVIVNDVVAEAERILSILQDDRAGPGAPNA